MTTTETVSRRDPCDLVYGSVRAKVHPQPAPLHAHIREEGGRLLVRLVGHRAAGDWAALHADWRKTMVVGRHACWRRYLRAWSVRAADRGRLLAWCDAWGLDIREETAEGGAVNAGRARYGEIRGIVAVLGAQQDIPHLTPAAGEILRLCMRREELRRAVRQMPQRGAIGRQMARELGEIERQLGEIAAGAGMGGGEG